METRLPFEIERQPNDVSCGPTCLHALYTFFGDPLPLQQVIDEIPQVEGGGTLAVFLGCHALRRGYSATLYSFNLNVFDPTWFRDGVNLAERLEKQIAAKPIPKLQLACLAYREFLGLGGHIRLEDLSGDVLGRYVGQGLPILTGLSATYLYREAREIGPPFRGDDVQGVPVGHFVVLCGYDAAARTVLLADPLHPNPHSPAQPIYALPLERVICAILLGIVTYDGNLLIVEPGQERQRSRRAERHRGK